MIIYQLLTVINIFTILTGQVEPYCQFSLYTCRQFRSPCYQHTCAWTPFEVRSSYICIILQFLATEDGNRFPKRMAGVCIQVKRMVLLWVYTFLASIRFRKDSSLNSTLSTRYGKTLVSAYRHLQKTRFRRDKAALDIEFLLKFFSH